MTTTGTTPIPDTVGEPAPDTGSTESPTLSGDAAEPYSEGSWRGIAGVRAALATRRRRGRLVPVAVAAAMIASLGAAGTAYFALYRHDESSSDEVSRDVVSAADNGTVALLSYSPKTLDADLTKAKSHLTGQFLTYYQEFTTKVVKPAATENSVDTKAQVVRSAVSHLSGNDAQVLAFVNQTTTSKTKPDPELTSSSVRISLHKVDGDWLISSFDPL